MLMIIYWSNLQMTEQLVRQLKKIMIPQQMKLEI